MPNCNDVFFRSCKVHTRDSTICGKQSSTSNYPSLVLISVQFFIWYISMDVATRIGDYVDSIIILRDSYE